MKNGIKSNKCVTCKHCLYPEGNDKAYCGQRGDYIDEQYPSCVPANLIIFIQSAFISIFFFFRF